MLSLSRSETEIPEIPRSFSDDLIRKLALLHEAPPGIAESTIALLGLGTRAALEASDPPVIHTTEDGLITITNAGRQIIERCAALVESQGEDGLDSQDQAPDAWSGDHTARLNRALEILEDHPSPAPARDNRPLSAAHARRAQ